MIVLSSSCLMIPPCCLTEFKKASPSVVPYGNEIALLPFYVPLLPHIFLGCDPFEEEQLERVYLIRSVFELQRERWDF